jgi:hypothetical protein
MTPWLCDIFAAVVVVTNQGSRYFYIPFEYKHYSQIHQIFWFINYE